MVSLLFFIYIKSKSPHRSQTKKKNKKKLQYFNTFPLPPLSLSMSLLFLFPHLCRFPHGSLLCYLCAFSLYTDNSRSDLSWTALEGGGSCLLLYWGTCLLYCKDEGPWILDILPFPSPPPPTTISFRHSDCLLRLVFFSSEWQHMA